MKALLAVLALLASPAFAQDNVGQITMKPAAAEGQVDFNKNNFSEVGASISSINDGTRYTNLVIGTDFSNGFTLGARANVPMDYNRDAEIYMAQIFGRFPILNNENIIYIETALTQAFLNYKGSEENRSSTQLFGGFGASYGYARRFTNNLSLGVALGVDWMSNRITRDTMVSGATLANHVALTGGYYF